MQEENLKKQEESVQKQEAMRRGQVVGCFYAYIVVDDECVTMHCVDLFGLYPNLINIKLIISSLGVHEVVSTLLHYFN